MISYKFSLFGVLIIFCVGCIQTTDGYLSTPLNIESTIDGLVSSLRDIDRRELEKRYAGGKTFKRPYYQSSSEVILQDDGTYQLKVKNIIREGCIVIYYADSQKILRSYKVLTTSACRW